MQSTARSDFYGTICCFCMTLGEKKKGAGRLFNWRSPSQLQLLFHFFISKTGFYSLVMGLKTDAALLKESHAPCYFQAPMKKFKFYSELWRIALRTFSGKKKRPTRGRVKIVLGEAADIPPRSHTPAKVFHNNAELVVCYLPPTQLIKTYLSTPF